nr:13544_t:CDS:2 [Entrophospora candida]
MNKTNSKTLMTLIIVLIGFIFIVEFTSPIQSIEIEHLQKRQNPSLIVTVSTAVAIDGPIITTVATDSSVVTSSTGINVGPSSSSSSSVSNTSTTSVSTIMSFAPPFSSGHLDLEFTIYNLYSVATSLFVITVTMLYLIVA